MRAEFLEQGKRLVVLLPAESGEGFGKLILAARQELPQPPGQPFFLYPGRIAVRIERRPAAVRTIPGAAAQRPQRNAFGDAAQYTSQRRKGIHALSAWVLSTAEFSRLAV